MRRGKDFCRIKCTNLAIYLNTVGMTNKKAALSQLSDRETRMVDHLRQHPDMMGRFESILEIARNGDGPLKTADEVEELLIHEIRRLGNTTMNEWAGRAEERVALEVKGQDSTMRSRKRKR